jgi:hypothetical protein
VPFGIDELDDELARLQALRSSPPALAARAGRRRKVFSASVQQLGELLHASERVGLASAPLTLFYALAQGGRALAAARCRGPGDRYDFRGHGASVVHGPTLDETKIVLEPKGDARDGLSVVAEACASSLPSGTVTVARLWASLPLLTTAPGLGDGLPRPLHVHPRATNPQHEDYRLGGVILPLPTPPGGDDLSAAREQLAPYPAAASAALSHPRYPVHTADPALPMALEWLSPERTRPPLEDVCESFLGDLWLRPRVGDEDVVPTAFVTWWMLLLALSTEARYRPAEWTAAIDPDRSPLAVPLEVGLRRMVRVVPRMVLHSLTGRWV